MMCGAAKQTFRMGDEAMKQNMGSLDRAIRILLALVVGVLYLSGRIDGTGALILGVIAIVFILTSIVSFCPLYAPFRISTKSKRG